MPAIPELVRADGTYPTIPLEKDVVVLKVIQSGVNSLSDFPSIEEGLEANLKHMESLADQACTTGKKPDFLLFHEFPLTGYSSGIRTEKLPFTIQIPGKESDRLGEIAKSCDTYVIFGTYVTDDDWPNHILSINAVINREGKVVKKFWKPRKIKRLYPDREITTTTIEAVRDKDGVIEAEIPIAEFRKNRRIPNYAYEMVRPIFEQYKQEIPINHLDMPTEELPETGVEMKELFDRISRYIGENAGK